LVLRPLAIAVYAQQATAPDISAKEWALEDVVRTALSQHPLIEAARERIKAVQGTGQTARSLPNPVATYWTDDGTSAGQGSQLGLERETSAYVTIPLEGLFQRPPRIRRADADLRSAEISLVAARRSVALDAAHAFFRVALAQVALDVAEGAQRGLEQLVAYNRARVTEGAAAEVELLRVQLELDRATTNVTFAEVDLAKTRAELLPFVSADVLARASTEFRVAVPSAAPPESLVKPLAALATQARTQRSEVLSAGARVSTAQAEVDVQRALTVRQVGATVGLKRIEGTNSMIAGLSLPLPLFDRNRGEVQRATSDLQAAEQERAWAERAVTAEIRGAYDAAERLTTEVSRLQPSYLDRAEDVNRIIIGAYQEGAATLLQVIDAARTLADARVMFHRAVLGQCQSLFDLAMAAGEPPESAATASGSCRDSSSTESHPPRDVQR
jgi:cobalt-zinc-cadmium efflux system outer membrane protein